MGCQTHVQQCSSAMPLADHTIHMLAQCCTPICSHLALATLPPTKHPQHLQPVVEPGSPCMSTSLAWQHSNMSLKLRSRGLHVQCSRYIPYYTCKPILLNFKEILRCYLLHANLLWSLSPSAWPPCPHVPPGYGQDETVCTARAIWMV
jgi:hypothetical protein